MNDYKENLYMLLDGVKLEPNEFYNCGVNYYLAIFVKSCGEHGTLFKLGREYVLQILIGGIIQHYIVEPEFDNNGDVIDYACKKME